MRTLRLHHRWTQLPTYLALAALCVLTPSGPDLFALPSGASDPVADDEAEIERLSEWPKLESKSSTSKEITRLRKARTEEMEAESTAALVEAGAQIVPLLLKSLDKEKDEAARARITGVLDRVCGPAHSRLLAEEFDHRSVAVRCWALNKVSTTPDAGVRAAAEAALAAAEKNSEEKDGAAAEKLAAALCVTSTGSLAGLDTLFDAALSDWRTNGTSIRTSLEVVRGPEAAARYWETLDEGDRKARIATLRMLAGCGEKDAARKLSRMLDDTDNGIRVAAINALRGMVNGEPPLEKLATFAAIEKALEWKKRL